MKAIKTAIVIMVLSLPLAAHLPLDGPAYTYILIPAPNQTWGYNIFLDGKLKIHQPNIPGQSSQEGFRTQEAAEHIAHLVIEKLTKGEAWPTVTIEEMEKLGAL